MSWKGLKPADPNGSPPGPPPLPARSKASWPSCWVENVTRLVRSRKGKLWFQWKTEEWVDQRQENSNLCTSHIQNLHLKCHWGFHDCIKSALYLSADLWNHRLTCVQKMLLIISQMKVRCNNILGPLHEGKRDSFALCLNF